MRMTDRMVKPIYGFGVGSGLSYNLNLRAYSECFTIRLVTAIRPNLNCRNAAQWLLKSQSTSGR